LIVFSNLHELKAPPPKVVNDSGSFNALRLQPEKAEPSIAVTPSEIVTLSNDEQFSKQKSGIVVIPDGIFIAFSNLQSLKAPLPKVVNDSGSTTDSRFWHPLKANLQISTNPLSILTDVRFI